MRFSSNEPFSAVLRGMPPTWEAAPNRRTGIGPLITLSPEQEAQWKKRLEPIAADWAKGVPDGAKVLDAFRHEVATAAK